MAKLIYKLIGVRGREMEVYDTKCVITTKKTAGSLLTGNITDGEKTIFLCDVVGVQFKQSGGLIGYLQFETPSMQMNNKSDNMFSENTFTFEDGKNGITNSHMQTVYHYVVDRIEEIKYGKYSHAPRQDDPQTSVPSDEPVVTAPAITKPTPAEKTNEHLDTYWICGKCKTKNLNERNDCWFCSNPK